MKTKIIAILTVIVPMLGFGQTPAIHVEKTGTGKTVMLLPGFGCPGQIWDETVRQLAQNHECYTVSFAGFAGMQAIDSLWMSNYQTSIEHFIKVNKLTDITIIGHSFGSTLGMAIAKNLPKTVGRLIVVDMLPCIGETMIPNYKPEYITFDNPFNKQLMEMGDSDFRNMQMQSAANMTSDTLRQKQIARWMCNTDRKTYVYAYTESLKTDLRPDLKKIKQPTLILAAGRYPGKEQIMEIYQSQYKTMKHKTITFVDDSAHFIMFDQFDRFMKAITDFIK